MLACAWAYEGGDQHHVREQVDLAGRLAAHVGLDQVQLEFLLEHAAVVLRGGARRTAAPP